MLILAVLVFVSYIPSLSGQFLLDDYPYVKENSFIKDFHGPIAYLSQEDGIGYEPAGEYHSGYYRPLINLTYTLDYKLWGMSAGGFRLTNLLLHLATCLALYGFLGFLLGGGTGPFWAALLYGLHPAHTETVSWVVSRNNILVTLFSIASLYFYIQSLREGKRWSGCLSLLFFAAALLCKEFAIMLLPVFFLYHRLFDDDRHSFREEVFRYMAFGAIILAYLALRKNATLAFITPEDTAEHILRGLYFAPWLVFYNLRIILFPYDLHYFRVDYPNELLGIEAGIGFCGALILGVLLWRWRTHRSLIFAFLSFMMALFPVLHIVPSAAVSLVSMRWLYFPMVFLAIAGAWALNRIPVPKSAPLLPVIVPGALALFLGTYTLVLNQTLWKTEKTFFTQEIFGFQNEHYLGDLAKIYHLEGDRKQAYRLFQMALEKERDRPSTKSALYVDYGALLLDMGRLREALFYLDKAAGSRDSWKQRSGIDANMGVAHFKMKSFGEAIRLFRKAVMREPENAEFLGNLGNAYMAVGRYEEAIRLYRKSMDIRPDRVSTKTMLGIAHLKAGNYRQAVNVFEGLPTDVLRKNPAIEKMLSEARGEMANVHRKNDSRSGVSGVPHAE